MRGHLVGRISKEEPPRRPRSSSRDTAVACFCCCDGADAAGTKLLRAARVPPRVAVASLLEVLLAPPRGGTRRQLKGGRALRAGIAPSQQDQLRRSSRSRRRHCPATMSGRRGEKHHRTAPRRIIGQPLDGFATVTYLKLSSFTIYLPKELRSLP